MLSLQERTCVCPDCGRWWAWELQVAANGDEFDLTHSKDCPDCGAEGVVMLEHEAVQDQPA